MGILLGLEFAEELPTKTRDELEQLVAAIQAGFLRTSQAGAAICIVTHSTTQSIADATFEAVKFDTNESDVSLMHAVGASRIYIPQGQSGTYALKCSGMFAVNATGQRIIKVRKNGVTDLIGGGNFQGNPSGTYAATVSYDSDAVLNAGDYIEFLVYQNSGGALLIGGVNLYYSTRASVARIA